MALARVRHTTSLWWHGRLASSDIALAVLSLVIATAIVALPLTVSIVAVAGGILTFIILLRPVVGLAVLAVAVPFGSVMEVSVGGLPVSAAEPIAAITVVSWIVRLASRREQRLSLPSPTWPIVVFLCVVAFELTLVERASVGAKELLRWGELLAVAVVAGNVLRSRRQVLSVLAIMMAAGTLEALVGWYQFFLRVGPPAFAQGRFLRAYGTFSQPNPFAGYLAMVWPVALSLMIYWGACAIRSHFLVTRRTVVDSPGLALCGRASSPTMTVASRSSATRASEGTDTRGADSMLPRLLALISLTAVVVIGAGLLMSFSRGAWMGVAIATMFVAGLFKRRLLALLPVVAGLFMAIVLLGQFDLLPTAVTGRIGDVASYFRFFDARSVVATAQNWAVVERMASWQAAWRMFEAEPIFGVGPGHFVAAYARYGLPNWPPLGHAHNYYLNVLAEMGATGLAAYLLVLGGWFLGGLTYLRGLSLLGMKKGLHLERAVIIGVLGALTAAGVHNFFDNLYVHEMNIHVGLLIGVMMAIGQQHYCPVPIGPHATRPTR